MDYERAVWNTMSGYLPMAKLTGCLFHFEQAIRRKLQALGLISLFNQNEQFSFLVRQVQALPFVPVDSVVKYYEETVLAYMETLRKDENFSEFLERFNGFVTYLERTWIGASYIKDWNHYSDVMEGNGTTNNISESYNSSWTSSLSRRPTLYTILEHFALKDSWAEKILQEDCVAVGGNALENSKTRSLQRVQRALDLQAVCQDVENVTPAEYMKRLIGVLRD
jgi:hypothetical protein